MRKKRNTIADALELPSEWDAGTMCEDRRFHRHLWISYVV